MRNATAWQSLYPAGDANVTSVHFISPALVCALLPHGEHGAVLRFLTPDHGLVAGYVRGARSRRLRPALQRLNPDLPVEAIEGAVEER